eukprot:2988631-Pyramimonas_sp.AAC.1
MVLGRGRAPHNPSPGVDCRPAIGSLPALWHSCANLRPLDARVVENLLFPDLVRHSLGRAGGCGSRHRTTHNNICQKLSERRLQRASSLDISGSALGPLIWAVEKG